MEEETKLNDSQIQEPTQSILEKHAEAIIFVSEQAVSLKDLKDTLEKTFEQALSESVIKACIAAIADKYKSEDYAFELVNINEGYHFLSKAQYHKTISHYLNLKSKRQLSNASLETLSIIAYKQPITKAAIEEIRGVNCDYAVQKLLDKELISIAGRSDSIGKPLLYATGKLFLDYFGLKGMQDLPKLKEIIIEQNEIGERETISEQTPTSTGRES